MLDSAERLNVPVILSHAQVREGVAPLDVIGPVTVLSAQRAAVPVCVHPDHCTDLSYMARALELGFTGVMYDGSLLPYEENAENTRRAVSLARKYNSGVEAEIGKLAHREDGADNAGGSVYTEPELRPRHPDRRPGPQLRHQPRHLPEKPVPDLDRVALIRETVHLPLVMHGGSGVSPEDYRTAIRNGIRKINYFSYMSSAGAKAVREKLKREDVTYFHDLALTAQKAMSEDAEQAMRVFYGK